jgi:hypothetical protein
MLLITYTIIIFAFELKPIVEDVICVSMLICLTQFIQNSLLFWDMFMSTVFELRSPTNFYPQDESMNSHGGIISPGKTEELGDKPLSHTDILSATNPAWIDPGANPGLRGMRPASV